MTERPDPALTSPSSRGGDLPRREVRLNGFAPPGGLRLRLPVAAAAGLLLLAVCAVAAYGWNWARDWLHRQPTYLLDFDRIELVPAPPPLLLGGREKILRQVRERGEYREPIRLLDQDAGELARAFALHSPWIARVRRVDRREPGRLVVEVIYREPVARVEVSPRRLRAVAADRVVLPAEEIAPRALEKLPKLEGLKAVREVAPGLVLGADSAGEVHPDVTATVALAAFLRSYPRGVDRIVCYDTNGIRHLMVRSRAGFWIDWGNAPGQEQEGEPRSTTKLALLLAWEEGRGARPVPEGDYLEFRGDHARLSYEFLGIPPPTRERPKS